MSLKGKKHTKKKVSTNSAKAVLSDAVGNYENHPFFVKKNNAAKALISKVGLPKELITKKEA